MIFSSVAEMQQQQKKIDEIHGVLAYYEDGSVERFSATELLPACQHFADGVASRDVILQTQTGIWVRIFLPQNVADQRKKVPVVLHFHGGGLCIGSVAWAVFHRFCSSMAVKSQSVWISVEYRLAPEHRLPAAYDDAYDAFVWLSRQAQGYAADPWLVQYADFSNCFFAGESSGGSIVHYLGARVAGRDWGSLVVRGMLILHVAFQIQDAPRPDTSKTLSIVTEMRPNTFYRLSLPLGADADIDHPFLDPLHREAPAIADVSFPPIIVAVADRDPLSCAGIFYFEAMLQSGHRVELFVTEGEGHCFYLRQPQSEKAELFEQTLVDFIQKYTIHMDSQRPIRVICQ
eukprot:c27688_g1_i1 orf=383-1417(-)